MAKVKYGINELAHDSFNGQTASEIAGSEMVSAVFGIGDNIAYSVNGVEVGGTFVVGADDTLVLTTKAQTKG